MRSVCRLILLALLAAVASCGGGGGTPPTVATTPAGKPDVQGPVISSITGARDGSSLIGTVLLRASAADDTAVTELTLDLDGARLATSNSAALEYRLDTQAYAVGAHKLMFRAIDGSGKKGEFELRVTFLLGGDPALPPEAEPDPGPSPPPSPIELPANPNDHLPAVELPGAPPDPTDTVPPRAILLTSVESNDVVWDTIDFGVQGIDDKGIWKIEIWWGGRIIAYKVGDRYLQTQLDTEVVPDGRSYVGVRLVDFGGNHAVCDVPLQVQNSIDHEEPDFTLWHYSREDEITGNFLLAAEATDDHAIANMKLHIDGEVVAESPSGSLEYLWPTAAGSDGLYQVAVTATDTAGKQSQTWAYYEVVNAPQRFTVSGTIYAPNGVDPLPDLRVRIPKAVRRAKWLDLGLRYFRDSGYFDPEDSTGLRTDEQGRFEIRNVAPGLRTLLIHHGYYDDEENFVVGEFNLSGNLALPKANTTLSPAAAGLPSIAVVTGDDEGLESFFAKCGYGQTDGQGKLILGTEKFLLVDGNNSLPDGAYMNFPQFMSVALQQTSLLCIGAGNHYEHDLFDNPSFLPALRIWAGMGHSGPDGPRRLLYCGGSAYDFIEQAAPSWLDFRGSDAEEWDEDMPELWNAAESSEARPQNQAWMHFASNSDTPVPLTIRWLQGRGFASLQNDTFFPSPLPAGCVALRNDSTYYGLLDTDEHFGESDEGHYGLWAWGGIWDCEVLFNGLTVPKQPSPQWTLQERLLQLRLNPYREF
jgi:hypothetical protein